MSEGNEGMMICTAVVTVRSVFRCSTSRFAVKICVA